MTFYFSTEIQTIMDKSLGTNLHLWRFFTRAKQIHLHLFSPSPSPLPTMLDTCTRYFSRVSTFYWGGGGGGGRKQRILKRIRVLFLKFRFKNTGINAITQVSQGNLSTIVALLAEILANKFCPSAVVPALQSIWFYYTNDYIWVVAWSQYV